MQFLKDFGAIVAIILAVLGATLSYGMMKQTVTQNSKDIDELKTLTSTIKESLDRIEGAMGTKPRK